MSGGGRFVLGLAMVLVSLIGLTLASRAADAAFYWVGLAFAGFGVLFIYGMIVRYAGTTNKS